MYKVMVQASPEYRTKPEDLLNLYVKNPQGGHGTVLNLH